MIYLSNLFPVSATIRYCRNVARGIVSAARQKRINLLILGWHGRSRAPMFDLGSTIDPVIERAPCNVVVLKDCGDRKFHRILVPVAGGPNSAFALEVAGILAEDPDGEITAFTVTGGRRAFDVEAFVEANRDRLRLPPERVHVKITPSRFVVDAILEEAEGYDLVVLGCTGDPVIYKAARASVPETVAKLCQTPVAMVKAATGIRSWVKRWL